MKTDYRAPAPFVLSQGAEHLNASRRDVTETLRWFFELPESQQVKGVHY